MELYHGVRNIKVQLTRCFCVHSVCDYAKNIVNLIEFFPNWNLLSIGSLHKYFSKIKTFSQLCWHLNPQPLAYEARTVLQDHSGR